MFERSFDGAGVSAGGLSGPSGFPVETTAAGDDGDLAGSLIALSRLSVARLSLEDLLTRVAARDNAHLEDVIQKLISLPGVVRTRTEVALRERVPQRLLPLVESIGRAARK